MEIIDSMCDLTPNTGNPDFEARLRYLRDKRKGEVGVIKVRPRRAYAQWLDEATGFELQTGDRYLQLHLPMDTAIVLTEIADSLKGVAYYLKDQPILPKYVLGTTYGQLGRVCTRFGFRLSEKPLPNHIDHLKFFYPDTPRAQLGKPIGQIVLVFQESSRFLARFYGTSR